MEGMERYRQHSVLFILSAGHLPQSSLRLKKKEITRQSLPQFYKFWEFIPSPVEPFVMVALRRRLQIIDENKEFS